MTADLDRWTQLLSTYRPAAEAGILEAQGFEALETLLHDLNNEYQRKAETERCLRIGVVGQIKRGKSSFLNTLLFDSEAVLPRAATPMTAALTCLKYGDTMQATVQFYTPEEWQLIERTAQETDAASLPSQEAQSCRELCQMARQSGAAVHDYLGREQTFNGKRLETLMAQLDDYVGAEGRYTPLVKSLTLQLRHPSLKDLEVVDTPGFNDPILSRSRRAQEALSQCDVVFLLSSAGQFLDRHDMALLGQNLPENGIRDIVLIGTLFDNVLLDEGGDYEDLKQALPTLIQKLNGQAHHQVEALSRILAQNGGDGQANPWFQRLVAGLRGALPPLFISARCLDLARKLRQGRPLEDNERHTLEQLQRVAKMTLNADILAALANFQPVEARLAELRQRKQVILADSLRNFLDGRRAGIRRRLQQLHDDLDARERQLADGDLARLDRETAELRQQLQALESHLRPVFETYRIEAEKAFLRLPQQMRTRALEAKRLETHLGERTETCRVQVGTEWDPGVWPWEWFDTKPVYDTETYTVSYRYANVQESLYKLEAFVQEGCAQLVQVIDAAFQPEALRNDILHVLEHYLDLSQVDAVRVRRHIHNALARLTIPRLQLDVQQHIEAVRQRFTSTTVEDGDIEQLRRQVAQCADAIVTALAAEIERQKTTLLEAFDRTCADFLPTLTAEVQDHLERLRQDIEDRHANLERFAHWRKQLAQDLAQF